MELDDTEEVNLFRPAKRRKVQRSRLRAQDGNTNIEVDSPSTEPSTRNSDQSNEPAIAEILRLRKANKSRRHGIEFSNTRNNAAYEAGMSNSVALIDPQVDKLKAISDRFVGHTGQIVDVDKHMVAYIDAEMAKRRPGQEVLLRATADPVEDQSSGLDSDDFEEEISKDRRIAQRHPASLGKIHEIDLGADATLRNLQRTQTAIRRTQNGRVVPVEEEKPRKPRKPRMGRDGKPMKPRPGKRRNSEDIKRDQLVEQVLKESRLEIYDGPESTPQGNPNEGMDTDERIAEQFRQDFMDAMESRQRHRTAGQPKMPAGGKPGEVGQKGPKLGGSRSARAAMREKELADQKAKK